MEKQKWMQQAVPPSHRGLFTAKAKKAGYSSPQEYARHVLANPDRYDDETRHQAQFAVNAATVARRRKLRRKR
jgi:hypothetical protein